MIFSFGQLYKVILKLLMSLCVLIVTCIFYFIAIATLPELKFIIPSTICGLLIGLLLATYFYTILLIPYEMLSRFDHLKNKVAYSSYHTVSEFQKEVALYILDFFKLPGANVYGGIFHFNGAEKLIMNVPDIDIANEIQKTMTKGEIRQVKINDKKSIVVPITLGKISLGYMVLFTKPMSLPFLKSIISDFENYFLDDQLMHVIRQCSNDNQ